MFPKGTSIEEFIDILVEHLLGKGWYINYATLNREQVLTEILGAILLNYKSYDYCQLSWYKKLRIWLKNRYT